MSRFRLACFAFGSPARWRTVVFATFCMGAGRSAGGAESPAAAVVHPPTVIEEQRPAYPTEAQAVGTRGDVAVTITVDAQGAVTAVELARGVAPALDRAAMEAAGRWRFQPAVRDDGVPVSSRVQLLFHFEPPAAPVRPAAAAPPSDPAALDVTVVGRRPVSNRGASDFQIQIGDLAQVPRANASELLKLAPGILLTNEGGEGHAEQVFLRGFDAREGQDIEFSVNGVPINEAGNLHGNGYADTHFIIPELVESLRVVEGPFDPRQGNFAVAGSATYDLGLGDRGLTARYTTGSWGTRRLLLLWGPTGESRHTFGGAEIYQSDGFGQNRDSRRATAMAQYEGSIGARGTYRLLGTAYATDYHSAGVLRQDDYQQGRKGFYDTYDFGQGGQASRFSLAADVERRGENTVLSQQLFVISRGMRLLENFTGFLLDVQDPLQRPHGQRGDLLDLEVAETTLGGRGTAHWQTTLLGQ
ncbi:MAG: hypothetical protein QOI66_2023, partial [Myxococcales bacterium]|nr:hypothetical protein [Myxococcales bacterium]